ncbi:thioesterase II family protein [Paracidobacterium acidisoli]|uniref:Thioesterase n=1 Tax=Paracidobacterium acidisoli TaxID=2303751 RepID=A0A372IL47_9BACT|nr:alpha/beta fold hydrolase [Paracidobacterium acidisoli]MBT9332221.1 alpha/beta fold hydrolase [Paracidobacterium acidisoli]
MRLFCFPYAGGAPASFFSWAELLGPEIEVVCVQPPGRGARFIEPGYTGLDAMADEATQALSAWRDRPFAFYGHSLGAWVAFEVMRRLRMDGRRQPAHFFAGASRPPHLGPLTPAIRNMTDEGFLEAIQNRYAGIPAEVRAEPELLQMFLPVLRADFTAYETYLCSEAAPLQTPMTVLTGAEDRLVTPEITRQWERHAGGGFAMQILPGDHFFLNTSRDALLEVIRDRLFGDGAIAAGTPDRIRRDAHVATADHAG